MTCIAGVVDNKGRVYIGGDSASTAGDALMVREDRKVFPKGATIMGFCGSYRAGQLLRYRFEPPRCPSALQPADYMATRFVDALRDCLEAGGFDWEAEDEPSAFLVGYRSKLFFIESDLQVGQAKAPYYALGSGGEYAIGALHEMYVNEPELTPRERLGRALLAAEHWCSTVRAPFFIEELKRPRASRPVASTAPKRKR